MLDSLRSWVLGIVGAGVICGVCRSLTPEGGGKRVMGVVCGFVMMLAVVSILKINGAGDIGRYIAQYNLEAGEITERARADGAVQTRFIIEARCEAYILDKAAALGVALSEVRVTARWSEEGFWYPAECVLKGDESAELSRTIESELGIPRAGQMWSTEDG